MACSGPGKWPLIDKTQGDYEVLYVYDRGGPEGAVRPLSPEEVWKAQGRTQPEWLALVEKLGSEQAAYAEGCRATGLRTAESLLTWAATTVCGRPAQTAGAIRDGPEDESLARLLIWLRKWKQGDFGWEDQLRKAGGQNLSIVSRLGKQCGLRSWTRKRTTLRETNARLEEGEDGRHSSRKLRQSSSPARLVPVLMVMFMDESRIG